MDNWTMYSLLKDHASLLKVIFDRCIQLQISLNLKKSIFCVPFWILMGHIFFQQELMVDPINIVVIFNLEIPANVKKLRSILGRIGYY